MSNPSNVSFLNLISLTFILHFLNLLHGYFILIKYLDGIVGEVLFYVLKVCLGAVYVPSLHKVWVKVYSRMLRTIVPIAVALELKGSRGGHGEAAKERPTIRASYMFSPAQTMAFAQAAELAGEDRDELVELKSERIRTGEITKLTSSGKLNSNRTAATTVL